MHDRSDDPSDGGRSRHEHERDRRERKGDDRGRDCGSPRHDRNEHDCDPPDDRGDGPDTRFLQLEMSEVLYAEAESVTKQALRDLLLEAAKARFRERFGDQINGLAQLAVDELLQDVLASLDIEDRIQQHNRNRESRRERLAGILRAVSRGAKPEPDEDSE